MDVLFFAVSGLLTTYLPRQCFAMTTTTTTPTVLTGTMPSSSSSSSNQHNHSHRTVAMDERTNDTSLNQNFYNFNSVVFTVSLGLSFLLFTFNLLELFPQSWLMWIDTSTGHSDHGSSVVSTAVLTITDLYRVILWMITIHCMIVIPSGMGTSIMMMLMLRRQHDSNDHHSSSSDISRNNENHHENVNADDRKKRNVPKRAFVGRRHWTVRVFYYALKTTTSVAASTVWYYVLSPFYRMVQYYMIIPVRHKFTWCERYSFLPTTTSSQTGRRATNHSFLVRCCCYDPVLRKCVLYGSLVGTCALALLVRSIYPLVIEPQPEQDGSNSSLLLYSIKCLCAVGIIISTILNGFGSISLPYTCIAGLFVEPIPYEIIRKAEMELEQIKVNLNNKIQDFLTLSDETAGTTIPLGSVRSMSSNHTASPLKSSLTFWINPMRKRSRNFSEITNDAALQHRQKITTLSSEIEFLETLMDDMTNNVEEMRFTQSMSYDARTTLGKARSYMGIFFSVLLLSRLLAAWSNVGSEYLTTANGILSSLWRPQPTAATSTTGTNIDLVTRIVLWLSGHQMATTDSLHTISQCISLFVTAVLSISQIRVFLRTIATLQRRINNFYRKCYCQPLRFGCSNGINRMHHHHHRHGKMKLSSTFTDVTIASYMSRPPNQSPQHYHDSSVVEHRHQSSDATTPTLEYNVWFLSHPISFLLCCYCLACIVLTKMMLPVEFRTNFFNALVVLTNHEPQSHLFVIRTYTTDVLYSITALISGTVLAITLSFMRSNVRRIQLYSSNTCNNNHGINRSPSYNVAV